MILNELSNWFASSSKSTYFAMNVVHFWKASILEESDAWRKLMRRCMSSACLLPSPIIRM